ncbi:unnamed protein product [Caretta caretta]
MQVKLASFISSKKSKTNLYRAHFPSFFSTATLRVCVVRCQHEDPGKEAICDDIVSAKWNQELDKEIAAKLIESATELDVIPDTRPERRKWKLSRFNKVTSEHLGRDFKETIGGASLDGREERRTFSSLTKFRFWRPGAKQARVAEKFVVSKSVVLHILKNNNDILKEYEISTNRGYKYQHHGKEADFGEALGFWFQHKLGQGTHLSRLILKQKGTQLAAKQEDESNNSDGWLSHWFSVRNTVRNKMLIFWQLLKWNVDTLLSILDEFQPHDIFSADDTALCYQAFQDRTLGMLRKVFMAGGESYGVHCIVLCNHGRGEKMVSYGDGKGEDPFVSLKLTQNCL